MSTIPVVKYFCLKRMERNAMRSSIFNKFAGLPKEFQEDLSVLWKLPQQVRMGLIAHIPKIAKARTSGQKKIAMDEAVEELEGNSADVLKCLRLMGFIYEEWSPIYDTAASFLKDLADLYLIPEEKVEEAKDFLIEFLAEVEKDNKYRLEKMFASSLLPSLEQQTTLVDFRAVIRKPFGTGLKDDIEEYEPTCVGFTPVIIVRLRRDAGEPRSFAFQCEEDSLNMLIESLQAALMDLKAAEKCLPGGAKS